MKCIRRISCTTRLFLTFDDGPAGVATDATLDLLAELGVQATFFVVAQHARVQPARLQRMLAAGHAIGNHSLDHRFRPYFASRQRMLHWIKSAEDSLSDLLGIPTVGFRAPAGVRTPHLHWALRQLQMPLIHWNIRFYDACWPWREAKAVTSLHKTSPGSIVLLHDRQPEERLRQFLSTLASYIQAARRAGFVLAPLRPEDIVTSV